jgi:hypothetical protein
MPIPPRARFSASPDEATHGQKLYTIYAKDPVAYGFPASPMAPEGQPTSLGDPLQVLVKEAWTPRSTTEPNPDVFDHPSRLRPALRDGTLHTPDQPAGLYIMFQLPPETPDTDQGWVYGTIAPDGQTITGAGRMAGCMGCHVEAPGGDRIFGLPSSLE